MLLETRNLKPCGYTHGCGSQLSNLLRQTWQSSFKTIPKPCRTWCIFKGIHVNQFISWTFLILSNVSNSMKLLCRLGWVCPAGAAGWGFIMTAALRVGYWLLHKKHLQIIWYCMYINTYIYVLVSFNMLLDKDIYWTNEHLAHFWTTVLKILQMK